MQTMERSNVVTVLPLYEEYYVNETNTEMEYAVVRINSSSKEKHEKENLKLDLFYSKLSPIEDNVVAIYLSIIGASSIFLNLMVMFVCFKKRHTLKAIDYYIVNLAINDLFLPLFGFPLVVSSSLQHEWIFGVFGCYAYGFLGFFCGAVSISTLALMSFVRYMSVCQMQKSLIFTTNTTKLVITTYLYASVWSLPPFLGWGEYGVEPHGTSCTIKWSGSRSFVTAMLLMCIILPVVIMTFCYGRVLIFLKRSSANLQKWSVPRSNKKTSKREGSLLKLTFTMCVAFVGTWTPYAVVSLWTAYGSKDTIPIRLTLSAVMIAKLSTVINPTIYFVLNRKFRPFVKRYLTMPFNGLRNLVVDKSSSSG